MLQTFFSFLIIASSSITSLWARSTIVVEREFDAFRHERGSPVSKSVQFLKTLRDKDDIIAILNKGDGVHGFSKRKATDAEAKIALNALLFAKKNSPNAFPFIEKIDSFGSDAVKRHRHFVKVAWRLLDPRLGHVGEGTDFEKDDRGYRNFRTLVREHVKFENTSFYTYGPYVGEGGIYIDNGVGKTKQYGLELARAPYFHAYDPLQFEAGEATISSTVRFKLPTTSMRQFLPAAIKGLITGIPDANLDIFVVSQDLPWKADVDILYRPQYWLDPIAPFEQEGYDHAFHVSLSSHPTPVGITISHAEGPISDGVNSHTEAGTNWIVSSGPTPSAGGVLNEKRGQNFTFFTLTKVNAVTQYQPASGRIQGPERHALTLHLILNSAGKTKTGNIAQTLSQLGASKIYHLSELLDNDATLNRLYRFGF